MELGLAVDHPLVRLAVTRALGLELRILDLAEVVFGQLDVRGRDVLREPAQLGRPGDRNDPRLLREQPCECDLREWIQSLVVTKSSSRGTSPSAIARPTAPSFP